MKIEEASGKEERRIVTGMIVDRLVLGRIASRWQRDLFRSKWTNMVAELCVKYYGKYGDAPGKAIEGMFESWAQESRDKESVNLVERFLSGLSSEYEALKQETNSPYVIDLAAKHFSRVKLERLAETVTGQLDAGSVEKAAKAVTEFGVVKMTGHERIDVLADAQALERAFASRKKPLLEFGGALGKFFGDSMVRTGWIVLQGPEKIGKTTWLVELAYRAMLQRRRVAFFACGDENEEEMMMRFGVRAAKKPSRPGRAVRIPLSISQEAGDKIATVEFDESFVYKHALTLEEAKKALYEVRRYKLKSKDEFLGLSVHANSTLSVKDMDTTLREWEREGWVPDVIVVDYMDILAESGAGDDFRHRVNATWKEFRGLLQTWHCLGISATQADAGSYDKETQDRSNFSEDKRKNAHPTGIIGLNQSSDEKDKGIMRLNWIVRRNDFFSSLSCCHVAGCMEIGCPAIRSCM